MVHLVNGRGQLGKHLSILLQKNNLICAKETHVYHTWNVLDKTEQSQKEEYEKFKNFVDSKRDKTIIFISSSSTRETPYIRYKHLSESYLLSNCADGLAIRLPTIIGKGICEKLKYNKAKPYGIIELISCETAAKEVLKYIDYAGMLKSITIDGEKVSAELACKLLQF